jgi:head-tail adaptor
VLRAAELRHLVTIEAPATVLATTLQTVATGVPAKIVATMVTQAGEQVGAGGVQAATVYTVTIRYRTDLTEAMVLAETCCTQRRFQILAVVPHDDRAGLDLRCVTQGKA